MTETCKSCRFYKDGEATGQHKYFAEIAGYPDHFLQRYRGECRVHGPQIIRTLYPPMPLNYGDAIWPVVNPDDWCGLFVPMGGDE